MIEVKSLRKRRSEMELFIESLHIEKESTLYIIGPSGSGKSTLLHLLCGLCLPEEGEVTIDGHDVVAQARSGELHRLNVMLMSQELGLWYHLTVREHVEIVSPESAEIGFDLLQRMGLGHRLKHRPEELSGGERQRLALARALSTDPAYLFLDEPFASLDPVTAAELELLVRELQKERGFARVEVTHRVNQMFSNDDRIVMIEAGRMSNDTTLEGLIRDPKTEWGRKWIKLWRDGSLDRRSE